MSSIQDRQGQAFDLRAMQRGANFRMLRYREADIYPNPIIHHKGVIVHGEGINPMVAAEQFDTYVAKIPKISLFQAVCCGGYELKDALAPHSEWSISNDEGATWIKLRQLGDVNRISPVRYHLTLVRMGI